MIYQKKKDKKGLEIEKWVTVQEKNKHKKEKIKHFTDNITHEMPKVRRFKIYFFTFDRHIEIWFYLKAGLLPEKAKKMILIENFNLKG